MNKLKNKVFLVLTLILTAFLLSILIIFNAQDYTKEVESVRTNLDRVENIGLFGHDKPEIPSNSDDIKHSRDDEPKRIFMDSIVYTITYDENSSIINIVNHTESDEIDSKIQSIATDIIKSSNKKDKIGNLYFSDYSYSFKGASTLILIDNTSTKQSLQKTLLTSLVIFILLEIIIIFVSKKLTNWIIKPAIESLDKQKQFIADASHELKTPLAVILASSEALETDFQEKWINNIKNETERMTRLISNLLNLAKLENSSGKEYFSINCLSKIIEKSCLTFEGLIFEKNVKLTTNINENINFNCNSDEIKQLCTILLDNAIKHSIQDGEIIVSLESERNDIIFKVANKGNPIPKNQEEKIFERFYRGDESRNRNDNRYGLGLAIAKSIVLNHNGTISASSSNGYTTFKVVFKKK